MDTKSVIPFPRDPGPASRHRLAAGNRQDQPRIPAPTSSGIASRHRAALRLVPAGPDARWAEAFAGISPVWRAGKEALGKAFAATCRAFAEIADAPHDLDLTMRHYRALRDLTFTEIEASYFIAAAAGAPNNADVEDLIHTIAPALKELATCSIKPDPEVVRHWSSILLSFCPPDEATAENNELQDPK